MKHTKTPVFSIILITALLITGCSNSSEPDNDVSASPVAAPTVSPEPSPIASDKPVEINLDYASDEILGNYDSFEEYIENRTAERLIISTNVPAKDFKLMSLGYTEEGEAIILHEDAILLALDELLPDKPLAIGVDIPDTVPRHGFSFTDETGETKRFYISMSGMDGSLLMIEF